jgi:hypothetical protein
MMKKETVLKGENIFALTRKLLVELRKGQKLLNNLVKT